MRIKQIPDWLFVTVNAITAMIIIFAGLGTNLVKKADIPFLVGASFVAVIASILSAISRNSHSQPLWRKFMVIVPLILFAAFGTYRSIPSGSSESSKYVPLPTTSALPQVMKPKGSTLDYSHIDWQISISDETRAPLVDGKPFKLQGYIGIDDGEYKLKRMIMAHCISCSVVAILDLKLPKETQALKDGQWVEAQGTAKVEKIDGSYNLVLISDKITPVNEPQEPYLTP